jgi:radical SAM superfamily enzyme YgiQ (UPF0313 family)
LIYPNQYYVGMSNLGFQTIYGLLNERPNVVCERAFLPTAEEQEKLCSQHRPLLSLESRRPLSDFEILAFSLSFENDFINLLAILDLAGIPLESLERKPLDPLIIAGGVAAFLNPEPLAEFVDVFLLGEAEEVLPASMDIYQNIRDAKHPRDDFLFRLASVGGAYVPRFYEPLYDKNGFIREVLVKPPFPEQVRRTYVKDIDGFITKSVVSTPHTEFGDMMLLEVNRGCPRHCFFCSACSVYSPYRNRSLRNLTTAAAEAIGKGKRIGLTGAAVSDHPEFEPLCEFIVNHGGTFSLASIRLDNITDPLCRSFKMGGVKTVALAPEAGSERLRTLVRKGITEEDILRATEILLENEILNLRLYFLVGIPTETDEDVEAIIQLTRRLKHRMLQKGKSLGRLGKITLSINGLIPKPSTPFQWAPFEEIRRLHQKLRSIRSGLKKEANVSVTHDVPKWSYIQSLLSRGDRRVGKLLLAAHRSGGDWRKAFREININPDFYVYRERNRDEIFPWDFIDHGVSKESLWKRYVAATRPSSLS